MMIDFQTLMREHDELLRLIERLDAMVSGGPAPVPAAQTLATLKTALEEHLAKEDEVIYPRLVAGTDQAAASVARETMIEFKDLTTHWAAYVAGWTAERLSADWLGFGEHTRLMMARLRARVCRENDLLYPLALAGAHIRLRA